MIHKKIYARSRNQIYSHPEDKNLSILNLMVQLNTFKRNIQRKDIFLLYYVKIIIFI